MWFHFWSCNEGIAIWQQCKKGYLQAKCKACPCAASFIFILLQRFKKTKKKSLKILWLTKHETYLVPFSSGKKTDKQEKVVSSSTPTRKQTQNQLTKKKKNIIKKLSKITKTNILKNLKKKKTRIHMLQPLHTLRTKTIYHESSIISKFNQANLNWNSKNKNQHPHIYHMHHHQYPLCTSLDVKIY